MGFVNIDDTQTHQELLLLVQEFSFTPIQDQGTFQSAFSDYKIYHVLCKKEILRAIRQSILVKFRV